MRSVYAPQVGLEPTTTRLTAGCSAIELLRNIESRQRPILPGRVQPSTFGTGELNYCVRYGNRWDLSVITTGRFSRLACRYLLLFARSAFFRPLPLLRSSPFRFFSVPLRFLSSALLPFSFCFRVLPFAFAPFFKLFPALHLSVHPDNCTKLTQYLQTLQLISLFL